jgi:hypothetical protein
MNGYHEIIAAFPELPSARMELLEELDAALEASSGRPHVVIRVGPRPYLYRAKDIFRAVADQGRPCFWDIVSSHETFEEARQASEALTV